MFAQILTTSLPIAVIAARHMQPEYLEENRPVFSGRMFQHVTFVQPSATFPGGTKLKCPGGCEAKLIVKRVKKGNKDRKATVVCPECHRGVTVRLPRQGFRIEESMKHCIFPVPGHVLVQTTYPIPPATGYPWTEHLAALADPPAESAETGQDFAPSPGFSTLGDSTDMQLLPPTTPEDPPPQSQQNHAYGSEFPPGAMEGAVQCGPVGSVPGSEAQTNLTPTNNSATGRRRRPLDFEDFMSSAMKRVAREKARDNRNNR